MEVGATNSTPGAGAASTGATSTGGSTADTTSLQGLELDDFFQLMIAELQNQDPLNPLENNEFLAQIATIREIGATNKLNETLDSLLLGQNLNSASSLIGKEIEALATTGDSVAGVVSRVTVNGGAVSVHVGSQSVRLENVREVKTAEAA